MFPVGFQVERGPRRLGSGVAGPAHSWPQTPPPSSHLPSAAAARCRGLWSPTRPPGPAESRCAVRPSRSGGVTGQLSQCHDLSPRSGCPQASSTAGTHRTRGGMQSLTDPADRTGTIGVEAFDATYGAGFQASDDSPHAVECDLVEDDGAFVAHRPTDADRPRRVAFVDGTMRTEARLTRTGADGDVSMGLAGSWAAGAVLVDGDEPARFDQVTTKRAVIFTGGQPVRLPDHRDGWRWEPYAVDGADVEAARQQLQRLMRDAEADIAEALSNDGWLTVLDGPLHGIRHRRGLPVIGYVKTHHRRMLAREHWVRVPELTAGARSGLFTMKDALYGCYLRVGDPGPWAGPWAGIARLEMPSGIGRDAAVEAAERAAGWLPVFASALHRDARAPVNLTPIAGLERHLHRLQGEARLALRAVREAVLERNREGRPA